MDSSANGGRREDALNGARRAAPRPAAVNAAASPEPLPPTMNRAEQFEDEKRRIMASCFAKRDERNALLQSYITHIRVVEDAMYPGSPPPPDAKPEHKKNRVIIVAVKNTGRVWMHKARENDDGSFQIGKSWNLEDLAKIEIFTNPRAQTEEQKQRAAWGGQVGFIITMTKAYYWNANTVKEKEFFISNLVKIYRKYTSGNVPDLIGFEQREKEELLRAIGASQPAPSPQQSGASSLQGPSSSDKPVVRTGPGPGPPQIRNIPPEQNAPVGRDLNGTPSSQPSMSPLQSPMKPPQPVQQGERPTTRERAPSAQDGHSMHSSRSRTPQPRSQRSQDLKLGIGRDMARPGLVASPMQSPSPNLAGQDSRSNLTSSYNSTNASRTDLDLPRNRLESFGSASSVNRSMDNVALAASTRDQWKPNGSPMRPRQEPDPYSKDRKLSEPTNISRSISSETPAIPSPQMVPERKRPPLQEEDLMKAEKQDPPSNNATTQPSIQDSTDRSVVTDRAIRPATPPRAPRPPGYQSSLTSPARNGLSPKGQTQSTPSLEEKGREKAAISTLKIIPPQPSSKNEAPATAATPIDAQSSATAEETRPAQTPTGSKRPELANKIRKAANAYNAFKPRAGGAGARLLAAKTKGADNEPDGVTSVVPAPSRDQTKTQEPQSPKSPTANGTIEKNLGPPELQITSPTSPAKAEFTGLGISEAVKSPTEEKDVVGSLPKSDAEKAPKLPERPARKRKSNIYFKTFTALGVDPMILEGRKIDFDDILDEFGLENKPLQKKTLDAVESSIKREIGRLEAGSWLGSSDHSDERVEMVEKLLDNAIAECDEMEGLLTVYSVELGTLNEDIAYIEAQSQGLQVQTANQKLLHTELQNLVNTISINSSQLEPLRRASMADHEGLDQIESALLLLYKALQTIDPTSIHHEGSLDSLSPNLGGNANLTNMKALQQKRDMYRNETLTFLQRLRNYVDPTFGAALIKTADAIRRSSSSGKGVMKLDTSAHDHARNALWQYSPLMLFAKEVDTIAWEDMIKAYRGRARPVYQEEFRDNAAAWKRSARKTSGEESDALFTSMEKESEGFSGTARKLTVKRSQTLARSFRSGSFDRKGTADRRGGEQKMFAYEVFAGIVDETIPVVCVEQNFVVDFFHASSTNGTDFIDAVTAAKPEQRIGTELSASRNLETDRVMNRRLVEAMEDIFTSWPIELQSLVDWAVSSDPFQGVGILCVIERKQLEMEGTNQEFVNRTLRKLHDHLSALLTRFVDDQVSAIEETKVKIKKRKGVIGFIKVFPNFSAVIENMVSTSDGTLEIRTTIDEAYKRINKAMFDSLRTIAQESPIANSYGGGLGNVADPEDKEALNYHILLIENMHHYYHEVEERGNPVLGEWRGKAALEMANHQESYVSAIIRRPLGKILDFIESLENIISSSQGVRAANEIPNHNPTHSKAAFRKVLSNYTNKEVHKHIATLKQRVEKHFGEADDPALSQKLIAQIFKECERRYHDLSARAKKIYEQVYENTLDKQQGEQIPEFLDLKIDGAFGR